MSYHIRTVFALGLLAAAGACATAAPAPEPVAAPAPVTTEPVYRGKF